MILLGGLAGGLSAAEPIACPFGYRFGDKFKPPGEPTGSNPYALLYRFEPGTKLVGLGKYEVGASAGTNVVNSVQAEGSGQPVEAARKLAAQFTAQYGRRPETSQDVTGEEWNWKDGPRSLTLRFEPDGGTIYLLWLDLTNKERDDRELTEWEAAHKQPAAVAASTPAPSAPLATPAAGDAWSDLSTISFDGAFGLTIGEVIEPPAGVKQGYGLGLRFPMTPKKPLPEGLRGTVLVTKKTHKLMSILLESRALTAPELAALTAELTKKLGPPGPDVMGTKLPSWQRLHRGVSLERTPGGLALTWTDIRLTSQALEEN